MPRTPWLPILHELNYLLASRGIESRSITLSQCKNEGIIVERRKGSDDTGILWSHWLKKAYIKPLELHKVTPIGDQYLTVNKEGGFITDFALQNAMARLREKMKESGYENDYFIMHALKAKGVSDAKNDRIAGQSEAMRKMYKKTVNWYEPPA